jgi:hypothetical protein
MEHCPRSPGAVLGEWEVDIFLICLARARTCRRERERSVFCSYSDWNGLSALNWLYLLWRVSRRRGRDSGRGQTQTATHTRCTNHLSASAQQILIRALPTRSEQRITASTKGAKLMNKLSSNPSYSWRRRNCAFSTLRKNNLSPGAARVNFVFCWIKRENSF